MFAFYTELLKTKSEQQFTDARAALETAGMKYRTYQQSEESRHMMHRAVNPGAFSPKHRGADLNPMAIQQMSMDGVPGVPSEVEYVIEVHKRDLPKAKKLIS